MERCLRHAVDRRVGPQHVDGFGAPGGTLLGERARFVLGIPRLQVGLLRQRDLFGLASVGARAPAGTRARASAGGGRCRTGGATRPCTGRCRRPRSRAPDVSRPWGTFGEVDPELFRQMPLQRGVVGLRRGHRLLVQQATVDGQPLAVPRLHLVRDRDVGVQIRVARPRIAVRERSPDQPPCLDLTRPVLAFAGEQHLALDERQRIGNGRIVRGFDDVGHLARGDSPQRDDGFDRAERQVETGHRGLPGSGVSRHRRRQLPSILRLTPVLADEELPRHLAADACDLVGGAAAARRLSLSKPAAAQLRC